ncbi:MAG TPA: DnaB-like helicase C-terminal domain-containing protein [Jiangellaceae bacterium]|nr:DnaB-like helicase C-terminal domain-containing protein [Jiangellaceae bacterium]
MNLDLDPEAALLTAVLHRPKNLDELDTTPQPHDFAGPNNRALWALITRMHDRGETVSPTTVGANLHKIRDQAPALDLGYIADLYGNTTVIPALANRYARLTVNAAGLRRITAAGQRAIQLATAGGDAQEVQETIRAEIDAATTEVAEALFIGETIDETIDSLDKPARAHPTPWPELNRFIRGWRPGALYAIGARPGVGKTILGAQAALGLAEHGAVAFVSLEMPRRELEVRVIANTAEVALGRLDGTSEDAAPLDSRDWQRISAQRPKWGTTPLAITDRPGMTLTDVKSHARSVARRKPLAGIVVDYLQLLEPTRDQANRSRYEIVSGFSRALKLLAKELDVPVIALAQLNRESAKDKRPPTLADLRDSGAIEQDSDVVILMHQPDALAHDVDVMVAKNRHGIQGVAELTRRGEFARLETRKWVPRFAPPPPAYNDN